MKNNVWSLFWKENRLVWELKITDLRGGALLRKRRQTMKKKNLRRKNKK